MSNDPREVLHDLFRGFGGKFNPKGIISASKENEAFQKARAEGHSPTVARRMAKEAANTPGPISRVRAAFTGNPVTALKSRLPGGKLAAGAGRLAGLVANPAVRWGLYIVGGYFLVLALVVVLTSAVAAPIAQAHQVATKVKCVATLGIACDDKDGPAAPIADELEEELSDDDKAELDQAIADGEVPDITQCVQGNTEDIKTILDKTPKMDPQVMEAWVIYALSITDESRPLDAVEFSEQYTDLILDYRDRNPDSPDPNVLDVLAVIQPNFDFSAGYKTRALAMARLAQDGKLDVESPEAAYDEYIRYRDMMLDQCEDAR